MTLTSLSRRALLAGTVAGLVIGRPAAADDALRSVTLRVADYKAGDTLLLKAAGLDNTPYQMKVSNFPSGNLILEAINAGAIDVGSMSETPPAFGAAGSARFRLVAVIRDDVNWQVVLVPKGSGIASVVDLKGKRVGFVRATTTHYYLARMLERVGLGFGDIQPVALGVPEGQAAFDRGSIDAWAIYGYSVPLALRDGARVLITANGYLSGNYLYAASPDALNDPARSAAIGDFLNRIRKAYLWRQANLDAWAALHSAAIQVPAALDVEILTHVSAPRTLLPVSDAAIASAQDVADTFHRIGVLPALPDMRPLFDRRYDDLLSTTMYR